MKISTHAPLAGRDGRRKVRRALCQGFQPTRPLRGATVWLRRYINGFVISTHAPLAGRDKGAADARALAADFNPRAPCGARPARHGTIAASRGFQPTRPLRGATSRIVRSHPGGDFNPRAPCGARPDRDGGRQWAQVPISTHAPLAGRDGLLLAGNRPEQSISTHAPLAGRDLHIVVTFNHGNISTHAPLAGRDEAPPLSGNTDNGISTHAPLAGRDDVELGDWLSRSPISTHAPLAGRDTISTLTATDFFSISTHAPLAGRDSASPRRRPV